jgi:hypothetical protein
MLQCTLIVAKESKVLQYRGCVLLLKRKLLHYAIATVTSATTFNQKKVVAKVLLLPFFGLVQHFFGVDFDTKPCSVLKYLSDSNLNIISYIKSKLMSQIY